MLQIKLNGLFLGGQIIANLIKMHLINISSNFWAWLRHYQKKMYWREKSIAFD